MGMISIYENWVRSDVTFLDCICTNYQLISYLFNSFFFLLLYDLLVRILTSKLNKSASFDHAIWTMLSYLHNRKKNKWVSLFQYKFSKYVGLSPNSKNIKLGHDWRSVALNRIGMNRALWSRLQLNPTQLDNRKNVQNRLKTLAPVESSWVGSDRKSDHTARSDSTRPVESDRIGSGRIGRCDQGFRLNKPAVDPFWSVI